MTPPPMSDRSTAASSRRPQPSRLQRRAPASLQIAGPGPHWNAAIPLLSPLAGSPTSPELTSPAESAAEVRPTREAPRAEQERKPAAAFKTWQHPAAPFYYGPAPPNPSSFVPA